MPEADDPERKRHTIDDHMFGDFYPHDHDGGRRS